MGRSIGQNNYVSIDGIDFSICETKPFDAQWYSFKINKAGIKYEIATCIATGFIVWFNGDFKAGRFNDLELARLEFTSRLLPGKRAIVNRIYCDDRFFITPYTFFLNRRLLKNIAARHENVNQRIRVWCCMRHIFRHGWRKHNLCFEAIIKLVQIKLQNGQPLAAVCLE